jgi:hypothetical protein
VDNLVRRAQLVEHSGLALFVLCHCSFELAGYQNGRLAVGPSLYYRQIDGLCLTIRPFVRIVDSIVDVSRFIVVAEFPRGLEHILPDELS